MEGLDPALGDRFVMPFDLPVDADAPPGCLTGPCLSEDVWAEFDPRLRASPYQEPDGELEDWNIGVLVVVDRERAGDD